MSEVIRISEDDMVLVENNLEEHLEVIVPRLQIRDILVEDNSVFYDIKKFGMDTCTREELISLFARVLVGRGLPTFGEIRDGFDDKRFWQDIEEAAKEKGWTKETGESK